VADWAVQLADQPARRQALAQLACQDIVAFWRQSVGPGAAHRHDHLTRRPAGGAYAAPDSWMDAAVPTEGSWWPACVDYLGRHSSPPEGPPSCGNPAAGYPALDDAPGHYVLQR
jgi:hypothetical protein